MGCCCSTRERLEERISAHLGDARIVRKDLGCPTLKYRQNAACCQCRGAGALVLTDSQVRACVEFHS